MGLVGIGWEMGYFGEIGTPSNKTIDGYVVKHTRIFYLFKIPLLDNDDHHSPCILATLLD